MKKASLLLLVFVVLLVSLPTSSVDAAHPILERFSKRYLKKNKLKKLGKRAQRAAMDLDLEEYTIKFEHDIIGMEPSWMIEEGYFNEHYFNLISTLVFGEYDINPITGYPRNQEAFQAHLQKKARDKVAKQEFNIIERANFHNARLNFLLHLTYSDDFGNNKIKNRSSLLDEDEVLRNLTDSLNNHLDFICNSNGIKKEQTGIFIQFDFEGANDMPRQFIPFIESLRTQLGEERLIYVVVPAEIKRRYGLSFDQIEQILAVADKIVIDATNFDKFEKRKPAKLTNFDPNSDVSVFGTLKKYLVSPEILNQLPHNEIKSYVAGPEVAEKRARMCIMLPYYGIEYHINERDQQMQKIGLVSLENFYSYEVGKSGKLSYTSGTVSKNDSLFGVLELPLDRNGDGQNDRNWVRRFYVDDEFTLMNKYFYLKDSLGIDNVALNALSYYKTSEKVKPMWAILALTYGKEREKLGWIIASFVMGFIPLGFVFSIYRNWEVRNALAKHGTIWTRFIMFFVLFVFLFLTAANIIPRKGVAIVVAVVILGAFMIYILIKKLLMRSKKYVNIVK